MNNLKGITNTYHGHISIKKIRSSNVVSQKDLPLITSFLM